MRRFLSRIANIFRPRAEREMNREINSHLGLIQEDLERQGLSPGEAKLAALRTFGGVEQSKELHRETRAFLWIDQLFRDIGYGYRNLRRSPAFALTALSALALGIGATTSIFSIVNAMLLKPLPLPGGDRMVIVLTRSASEGGDVGYQPSVSPAMFAHWRKQSDVLESVCAFSPDDEVINYTGGEVVEQWRYMRASADFFDCTGFTLLRGRTFAPEEDVPGGPLVAVIGEDLWKRRFNSDPAVVGRKISLNERPYTVVGVVADNPGMLEFGPYNEVYVPMNLDPNSTDHGQYFMAGAKLREGVTLEQAKDRIAASTAEYRSHFPKILSERESFTVMTVREMLVGGTRELLLILLGAVGLVLLIACTNVANLLLARSAGRSREIGIRAAVGAARMRIIRQLLTESVLLSVAGGAIGLYLGHAGMRMLLTSYSDALELVGENGSALTLDWRVGGFAILLSILCGLLFGLFPALHGSRVDLNTTLKVSANRTGTGFRQQKARAILVTSEVGLAVVLLIGSALLIRSFMMLHRVERGFTSRNVVTMRTVMAGDRHKDGAGIGETLRGGLATLRTVPGVAAAAAGCCIPLQDNSSLTFEIAGRDPVKDLQAAGWAPVSDGFFEVFEIPLKRGRTFDPRDTSTAAPIAIINEAMAKEFWKDGDPLNDRILIGKGIMKQFDSEPYRRIVGVVGDVRDAGLGNLPRPIIYIPASQIPDAFVSDFIRDSAMAWMIRTKDDAGRLAPVLQERLKQATGLPSSKLLMMDQVVSLSTVRESFGTLLMSIFGGAALLLASIGIYGLMSYTVQQRTQEIGIRLALGADAAKLRNIVIRQGMILALVGVAAGLAVSWGAARILEGFLYGVQSRDPIVFIAVPAFLATIAFIAVWIPARRALKIDPVEALRCE